MIKVRNLTKIYRSNKDEVIALNDVSLVLPNKGLVFILGKSGSGKSTFLNMLGGLDSATSGDILVDGVSIMSLDNNKLDRYRNDYIGIIYQNFNLFLNESVKSNIITASYISNVDTSEGEVVSLCNSLDLQGKENELVKNLSGGEKQRVAIARALIKNPKIILADEPTGNLDTKTTGIIFDILRNIAKEKLVVVISHDVNSAKKYADRIISLSDGRIVEDLVRNESYKEEKNDLVLPNNREYNDNEISQINDSLSKYNLKVRKNNQFIKHEYEAKEETQRLDFESKKPFFRFGLKVGNSFLKSTILSFVTTLLMITFIIGVLSIAQTFANFDNDRAIREVANSHQNKSFVINKAYSYSDNTKKTNKYYHVEITQKDIDLFKEAGYKGNIYEVYDTPVVTGSLNLRNERGYSSSPEELYLGIYTYTSLGTVVCDEEYLEYLFGDIKVLEGSIEDTYTSGKLIVTDYFADSLLAIQRLSGSNILVSDDLNRPYKKIVNEVLFERYIIGAVIDTGYKTRYESIIDKTKKIIDEPQNSVEISKEIFNLKESQKMYEELNSSLNFTYSLNQNFIDSYIEDVTHLPVWVKNAFISYQGLNGKEKVDGHVYEDESLAENTMIMSLPLYNRLFNKEIGDDFLGFEEKEIILYNYAFDQDTDEEARAKVVVKIVGLINVPEVRIGHVDTKTHTILAKTATIKYALVFDNIEDSLLVNDVGENNYFYTTSTSFSKIFEICNIIDIFKDVFLFIAIILICIALIILVSYNLRTIKKNQYRIGVYKGLGCPYKVFDLACIYNSFILVLLTFILSIIFVRISSNLVNDLLVEKFSEFSNLEIISTFKFIEFDLSNLLLYMLIILIISAISMFAPILKLRKMKPNLILNKSE